MTKQQGLEALGWSGATLLIVAYALNSRGILESQSLNYQLMNLAASVILMFYTYMKKAYPNVVLNLVWAIIALITLFGK